VREPNATHDGSPRSATTVASIEVRPTPLP
jgi:hypothetical protein